MKTFFKIVISELCWHGVEEGETPRIVSEWCEDKAEAEERYTKLIRGREELGKGVFRVVLDDEFLEKFAYHKKRMQTYGGGEFNFATRRAIKRDALNLLLPMMPKTKEEKREYMNKKDFILANL